VLPVINPNHCNRTNFSMDHYTFHHLPVYYKKIDSTNILRKEIQICIFITHVKNILNFFLSTNINELKVKKIMFNEM
jgi:hypothetical protein